MLQHVAATVVDQAELNLQQQRFLREQRLNAFPQAHGKERAGQGASTPANQHITAAQTKVALLRQKRSRKGLFLRALPNAEGKKYENFPRFLSVSNASFPYTYKKKAGGFGAGSDSSSSSDSETSALEAKSSRVGDEFQASVPPWNGILGRGGSSKSQMEGTLTKYEDDKVLLFVFHLCQELFSTCPLHLFEQVKQSIFFSEWQSEMKSIGLSCNRHDFMFWRRSQGDGGKM